MLISARVWKESFHDPCALKCLTGEECGDFEVSAQMTLWIGQLTCKSG